MENNGGNVHLFSSIIDSDKTLTGKKISIRGSVDGNLYLSM